MQREGNAQLLEELVGISGEVETIKERCYKVRKLMDEGTYKLNAILNIVENMKSREQTIMASSEDQAVLQQITEEQVDSLLEMLKSPAFQSLARQLLTKWIVQGPGKE